MSSVVDKSVLLRQTNITHTNQHRTLFFYLISTLSLYTDCFVTALPQAGTKQSV
jgi:hypothetical protein